jgi:selenium metabolism protein YedF
MLINISKLGRLIFMIKVNAVGDTCPIPVVKTKNAIKELNGSGSVETIVDNEIAVQNLTKMANQKGYGVKSEKLADGNFSVIMTIGDAVADESEVLCVPDSRKNTVVVISSNVMGNGNDELGAILIKGFIFALTQQDELPSTILFYNGGAKLTSEGSPAIEDLKSLEAQGVEILTCGTCLDFYGLKDKLLVGGVTNMYAIAEKMTTASLIIKP